MQREQKGTDTTEGNKRKGNTMAGIGNKLLETKENGKRTKRKRTGKSEDNERKRKGTKVTDTSAGDERNEKRTPGMEREK